MIMANPPLTPPRITTTNLTNTEVQEQNEAVSKWSSMVQRRLRQSLQQFNNGKNSTVQRPGRSERMLRTSLNSKTKQNYGVIDRVSIQFERHGVFVHKGVGNAVSYTHLRAHETDSYLVCRLLLEKK